MKKITLLMLLAMFSIMSSFAQSASTYGFLSTTGTYIDNSAGATTISGVRADTFMSSAQNIGFTFVYEGVSYTQFKMSSNGLISFNMTGTSSLTGNDFSTANANSRPIIAPLWDDLDGATPASSLASYELTGTAPNRVLTVEWKNWEWNYASSTPVISFQVKLYETTNIIEFIYRQEATAVSSGSASIGIGSATGSGSGSYLNLTNVSSPAVSSSTSITNINTKPATNQIFRFTPPTPCAGTPVAGSITPATQNICIGSTPSNLVATGYTTGATGITFQWEESDDNGATDAWTPVVGGTGATTATYTPPAFVGSTIYYRLNVTCTVSGQSAQTASVSINPPSAPATQATVMTSGTATLTSLPFSWTNGNGNRRVVIFNTVNSFTDPMNGNGPALTASAAYAGSGEQIVYDGTGTSVTVTGLTNGTTYYAKVYEYVRCGSGPYDFYFNVSTGTNEASGTTLSPPANDNFANAQPIACGNTYSGSTTYATLDEDSAPDGFGADMDAPNVWYSFTGSGIAQTVTLELCGSNYDTSVLVYTGTSGNLTLVAGNDDAGTTACPGAGTRSKLNFNSDGTTTYYIAIEGWNSTSTGNYIMNVTCATINPPAVPNQTCASALAVNVDGSTTNSDNSYGDVSSTQPSCDPFGAIQDVWFSFVAPTSGTVECVVTNGTMTSGNFNVYEGVDCSSLTPVTGTCNSDFTTSSTEAMTGLVAGSTYYVQVWSGSAEQGTFTLKLTDTSLANDSFSFVNFKAYPNPVSDVLNLSHSSEMSSVEVFNMLGQKVLAKDLNASQGQINISSLNSGNYFVKVTSEGQSKTIKIVKN